LFLIAAQVPLERDDVSLRLSFVYDPKKDTTAKNITPRTGSPALEGIIEEQDEVSPPRFW